MDKDSTADVLIQEQAQLPHRTGLRETRRFLSPHRADGRAVPRLRGKGIQPRTLEVFEDSASSTARCRLRGFAHPAQRDYLAEGRRVESLVAEGVVNSTPRRALSHARDAAANSSPST